MKPLLYTMILAGLVLVPATAPAQVPGEMLFDQGCDAFDLVQDLGSIFTLLGQEGRWLMRDLSDGTEVVYAFETIDLLPPPSEDPAELRGTTFVAWRLEGTGIRGTNRTDFTVTIVDELLNYTAFFQGVTFRGTSYKSGGISGTGTGNLATGEGAYDAVRVVLCKAGFGGK
ncbi:MAG: hypothetical protein WBP34_15580 [Thermoanaerobaculia bacterium]